MSQALFVDVGHHVGGGSSPNDILPLFGPFLCACFVWCWIFIKKDPTEGHGWCFQCYGDGGGGNQTYNI